MLKRFVFIAVIFLVFALSVFVPRQAAQWRAAKNPDSIREDSIRLDARIKEVRAAVQPFDDTLALAKSHPAFLDSVYSISYRYTGIEPHPEITTHRPYPFFVDSIRRTDSSLIIELFGVYSGGFPLTGTAHLQNDTLVLLWWELRTERQGLGANFKWSLVFELDIKSSDRLPVIVLADYDECYQHREFLIWQHGFLQLKSVMEYFSPRIVWARRYYPNLTCSSIR